MSIDSHFLEIFEYNYAKKHIAKKQKNIHAIEL